MQGGRAAVGEGGRPQPSMLHPMSVVGEEDGDAVDGEVDGGIVGEEEGKAVDGEVDSDTVDDEVDDEVDRLVAGAVVGAVLCEEVIGCCTFV